MKILLMLVGSIAVVLGIIGLFVPVLPTTPFLLLASACFVRSSERLHRMLLNNRVFGEHLRNYEEHRAIPRRAKILALATMWPSLLVSAYLVGHIALRAMLIAIGIGVSIYLLRMKTLESSTRSLRR